MSYIKPSDDFDFTSHRDYKQVVTNSLGEDSNLIKIIKECHEYIDFILCNQSMKISFQDGKESALTELKKYKFSSIDDVISFIKETAKSNYFLLYAYKELELYYDIVSLDYKIKGSISDYKKDFIRNYKIENILN